MNVDWLMRKEIIVESMLLSAIIAKWSRSLYDVISDPRFQV